MFSGRRSWIRRAINRTCGRCSRMSLSRSSSLITSDTAYEYIMFSHPALSLGRRPSLPGESGQNQFHKPVAGDGLEILWNALSVGEKRERFTGPCRLIEDRAKRTGLVQLREQQSLWTKDFE